MPRSELVDLDVIVVHVTAAAVKVDHPNSNSKGVWLPLSVVDAADPLIPGRKAEITITRHLAEEKGLA